MTKIKLNYKATEATIALFEVLEEQGQTYAQQDVYESLMKKLNERVKNHTHPVLSDDEIRLLGMTIQQNLMTQPIPKAYRKLFGLVIDAIRPEIPRLLITFNKENYESPSK